MKRGVMGVCVAISCYICVYDWCIYLCATMRNNAQNTTERRQRLSLFWHLFLSLYLIYTST
jgi:hypothetical protein